MNSITNTITRRIYAKKRGWVFTPKDFLDVGSRAAVDQTLSRLVQQGIIRRLDRGLYDFPKKHVLLGLLSPDIDSIAHAIAIQSGDLVFPSGAVAANLIGLSTQVPAKPVYMTNGNSRIKKVAGRIITFRHAKVPLIDSVNVNYLLQALSYLGKDNIDDIVILRCAKWLQSKDARLLGKVASKVPGWMADILKKIQSTFDGKLYLTT